VTVLFSRVNSAEFVGFHSLTNSIPSVHIFDFGKMKDT